MTGKIKGVPRALESKYHNCPVCLVIIEGVCRRPLNNAVTKQCFQIGEAGVSRQGGRKMWAKRTALQIKSKSRKKKMGKCAKKTCKTPKSP